MQNKDIISTTDLRYETNKVRDIVVRSTTAISNKRVTRRSFIKVIIGFFTAISFGNWLNLRNTREKVGEKTGKTESKYNYGKTSYGG